MATTTHSNEKIDSFSWDEGATEMDFFGETFDNPLIEKEEEEETEEETPKGNKKPEKEKETENPFEDFETSEEEEEDSEEDGEEPKGKKAKAGDSEDEEEFSPSGKNLSTLNFLKEKGLIDFELEEGEELDEEEADTFLAEKFEESVEARFESSLKGLPDSVKNLVKYAVNGGDVDKMIADLAENRSSGLSLDMDLDTEENQIAVMKHQLAQEGYDEEYIESNIEFLQDSNKLASVAKTQFGRWKKEEEKATVSRVEAQKKAKAEAKKNQIEYKKELGSILQETESINNLKFSKKDVQELPDYIGTPSIKTQDGREITPMYKDLMDTMKDKDKLLILAKLLKNGFDFKEVEKEIKTKETQKLKENIQRQNKTKKINSARGSSQTTKRLADYF